MSLSLTSRWFIRPGREAEAWAAIAALASTVQAQEPGTLTYWVHAPHSDSGLQSLPPSEPNAVVFVEEYRDAAAFHEHLNGPAFTEFIANHGDFFVQANSRPFTFVEFLTRRTGFTRPAAEPSATNGHPVMMFEIIANDQGKLKDFYTSVFHWNYEIGTGGFAYVKYPVQSLPHLGGIGQTQPNVPGFEPGHNFYLLVDDLEQTIQNVVSAGGTRFVEPVEVDGYHFAMVKDPEGNPLGLIRPFAP